MKVVKYLDVIAGKVKPKTFGNGTEVQTVSWDDVPELCSPTPFNKIGTVCVIAPPSLPFGFEMRTHPSWHDLHARILEGWGNASFEELDQKILDLEILSEITKTDWVGDDCPIYYDREDWVRWSSNFDDAWGDLPEQLEALFEDVAPHMPPYAGRAILLDHIAEKGLDCQPIGNRVMPPSLVDVLKLMLAKAEEDSNE
mgnify:CR=1 FL=1